MHVFIKSERHGGWFCSKCGKLQPRDRYNIEKHASVCWGDFDYEVKALEEDADLCYLLEDHPGSVVLKVFTVSLRNLPGLEGRFRGTNWTMVFEAEFPCGSKSPRVKCNVKNIRLDSMVAMIAAGYVTSVSKESDAEIIARVFPGVPGIYSLQMFTHIYKNRGYNFIKVLPPGPEKKLLTPLSYDRAAAEAEETAGEAVPLVVTDYLYRKKARILRVAFRDNGTYRIFLFSRGYAACNDRTDISKLFRMNFCLSADAVRAIKRFDRDYPEYLLDQYMKKSSNVLVPLLAADYHKGLELAAKCGAAGVAENFSALDYFEKDPNTYRNVRELFGLSPSVLRALDRSSATEPNIRRMEEISRYNHDLLRFDVYTPSMLEFMQRADITHEGRGNMSDVTGGMTDRQYLQILRYLRKHPDEGHYYCDYLNACHTLGEFMYGLTPGIPIRTAHDRTVARIRNDSNELLNRRFEVRVADEDYISLTTVATDEDLEFYKKDYYMVIAPEVSDDLFIESERMNNCVRIYVSNVADGNCRIYFLRRKDEPEKSFGTIEVSANGRALYQAKAFANGKLKRDAQKFVIKWCRAKHIRITTADISKAG